MIFSRRRLLQLAGAAGALSAVPGRASAQAYPARPLRWVVGFPPGGGADIVSRIMAPWLAERLGQPVVVENKPGASSNISVQTVATSAPDGYTLLFVPASAAVNVTLFDNLPFNLLRDIAPVSGLIDFPLVMVANPSIPAKTVAELIAYAKANPGKISIGSFGTGSTSHVAGELFKMMAGIDMIHVPYRGASPAFADLIPGRIDCYFGSGTLLSYARSGQVRVLASTGSKRDAAAPDVPTIAEAAIPGYEVTAWQGLFVPAKTAPEIVRKISADTNTALSDGAIKDKLAQSGYVAESSSPEELAKLLKAEIAQWAAVIKSVGIKID